MKFNRSLLVVIFLISTSWAATPRGACADEKLKIEECAKPHKAFIQSLSNVTGLEITNKTFMTSFSRFTRTVSACFGKVHCEPTRHYLYFLKALTFVTDQISDGDTFHCLEKVPRKEILKTCFFNSSINYDAFKSTDSFDKVLACVSKDLRKRSDCSSAVADRLRKAFLTIRDVSIQYKAYVNNKMQPTVFEEAKIGSYQTSGAVLSIVSP